MSLSTIMSTASSGLMAAQQGLRTVSDNIANVNTPGYVRKTLDQVSLVTAGAGAGVDVLGIRRVVDRYLQTASMTAIASAGSSGVLADLLDRVQGLFGNPASGNNLFSGLDQAFAEFSALANDPSSSLQRGEALNALENFFDDASRISGSLRNLRDETDTRIRGDVERANSLLSDIARLNGNITTARIAGADSSGSENIQAQLINELSNLMDLQMAPRPNGGVTLRTVDGMLLAGDTSGVLAWNKSDRAAGFLTLEPAGGAGQLFDAKLTGGEILGLIQMRDREIPAAQAQLAEMIGRTAEEFNRAHNAHTAVPAPATLAGRATGLDIKTAIDGFSGTTTLAVLDAAGAITRRIRIDFNGTGGAITVDNGLPASFLSVDFADALDDALDPVGAATFVDGVLTLNATSGGLAIADDATAPSLKASQGFSQFFGLNDLVRSAGAAPFDTGLAAGDLHGFAGGTITLRINDISGARLRDVTATVPVGGTVANLLTALNSTSGGVAPYGAFSLDANGRMTFAAAGSSGATISVVGDLSQRSVGGASLSAFFGIGPDAMASAAASFSINPAVNQDPSRLATARLNLAALAGTPAIAIADGKGALALAQVGEATTRFAAAGTFPAVSMTVSRYATEFAGALGRRSAAAESQLSSDQAVADEAENRRTSFEGVNMDEELVRLTTYQQAFNASARLIQAANDLYEVLLKMV